jgi:polyhydroxyalkanoate synthase subunit PhaC
MGTSTAIAAPEQSLIERLRSEVERAIQRNLKGFEFLGSQAPPVGPTPKTLLHRNGTLSLYHYRATASEVYRVPILLVMATTNKAYIFDLGPGQSLIEFLLARGYDVYVMDWNAPTDAERKLKLEDYTLAFIPECVRRVQKGSGVEDVTVIGYCMGGVLATIYAALHADGPLKTWSASRRRSTSRRWRYGRHGLTRNTLTLTGWSTRSGTSSLISSSAPSTCYAPPPWWEGR